MKSFPIAEIISNALKVFVKIFDDMYQAGWLLYFIIGLVILVVIIIVY